LGEKARGGLAIAGFRGDDQRVACADLLRMGLEQALGFRDVMGADRGL
jgi:hypothetical protein